MARTSKDAKCATFSTLKTAPEVTNPRNWKRRMDMTRIGVSRRKALEAGACALAGAAGRPGAGRARGGGGAGAGTQEKNPEREKAGGGKEKGEIQGPQGAKIILTNADGAQHMST